MITIAVITGISLAGFTEYMTSDTHVCEQNIGNVAITYSENPFSTKRVESITEIVDVKNGYVLYRTKCDYGWYEDSARTWQVASRLRHANKIVVKENYVDE